MPIFLSCERETAGGRTGGGDGGRVVVDWLMSLSISSNELTDGPVDGRRCQRMTEMTSLASDMTVRADLLTKRACHGIHEFCFTSNGCVSHVKTATCTEISTKAH